MSPSRPSPPRPLRPRRAAQLGKTLLALTGLAVGLGLAELAFRVRDDAGFPKLALLHREKTYPRKLRQAR